MNEKRFAVTQTVLGSGIYDFQAENELCESYDEDAYGEVCKKLNELNEICLKLNHKHSLLHDECTDLEVERNRLQNDVNSLEKENKELHFQVNLLREQSNEFHRGARENANRVRKLEKENKELKQFKEKALNIFIEYLIQREEHILNTVKEAYLNERTDLGKSVLRQLCENIGIEI